MQTAGLQNNQEKKIFFFFFLTKVKCAATKTSMLNPFSSQSHPAFAWKPIGLIFVNTFNCGLSRLTWRTSQLESSVIQLLWKAACHVDTSQRPLHVVHATLACSTSQGRLRVGHSRALLSLSSFTTTVTADWERRESLLTIQLHTQSSLEMFRTLSNGRNTVCRSCRLTSSSAWFSEVPKNK